MSEFNQNKYVQSYIKENYTECKLRLREHESHILTEYRKNLGISKNALLQKCLVYCYNDMIDVSDVKLSTPDKSEKIGD